MTTPQAAIDIGSNTVHLLVATHTHRGLRAIREDRSRLELGTDVAATGTIGHRKSRLAAEAVSRFTRCARRLGARRVQLVATQAIRSAANGREVVKEIEEASGLRVDVLAPRAESYLAGLGAELRHPAWGESQWVVDIGGASTQVGLMRAGELEACVSIPIGSLIGARYDAATMRSALQDAAAELGAFLQGATPGGDGPSGEPGWTAVGGAARRLARFTGRRRLPAHLTSDEIESATRLLNSERGVRAMRERGLEPGQRQLVGAGAQILGTVLAVSGVNGCTVSPFGLREGAIRHGASGRRNTAW